MADGEALSKSQADKLGESLRHDDISAGLIERLSAYREQLVHEARDASESVRSLTLYPVTPREGKSTQSIVAKLRRQPIALSRMQDIVGCRIIVDTVVEQDALALRIAARFPDARLVDRRVEPSHGYRAVHFVLRWRDKPYEIQVRTRLQHAWAQAVERLSDRLFPDLKYGKGDDELLSLIKGLSEAIQNLQEFEDLVFAKRTTHDAQERTAKLQTFRSDVLEMLNRLVTAMEP